MCVCCANMSTKENPFVLLTTLFFYRVIKAFFTGVKMCVLHGKISSQRSQIFRNNQGSNFFWKKIKSVIPHNKKYSFFFNKKKLFFLLFFFFLSFVFFSRAIFFWVVLLFFFENNIFVFFFWVWFSEQALGNLSGMIQHKVQNHLFFYFFVFFTKRTQATKTKDEPSTKKHQHKKNDEKQKTIKFMFRAQDLQNIQGTGW